MWDLLFKVAAGVVTAVAVGVVVHHVYSVITKETIRDTVNKDKKADGIVGKAVAAKIISKDATSVSWDMLDQYDEPVGSMQLVGSSVSDDIHVGDRIIL